MLTLLLAATQLLAADTIVMPDKIGRKEFVDVLSSKFPVMDKNHDGKIDLKEECKGYEPWCKAADKNKDGFLDRKEFLDYGKAEFNKADKNHDGAIDQQELKGITIFRF